MKQKSLIALASVLAGLMAGLVVGWAIWAPRPAWVSDLKCVDGTQPDKNGCCAGEVYTDMADLGFNCCPVDGGDCFPPIR